MLTAILYRPKIGCRILLASIVSLALSGGIATATPTTVAGTYSITPTGTGLTVSDLLSSPFSFPLNVGVADTVNFIKLNISEANGTHNYPLTVDVTFTFTLPTSNTASDNGSGTVAVQGHSLTGGSFTWSDGATGELITFSDGTELNLNLSDVAFTATTDSPTESQTVTATFTLVNGPIVSTPVPEPASLTVLATALLGLGMIGRRKAR